ncbi:hypothetical protein AVI51_11965 [Piscirickettsia salmonis]|uniref:Uncharacterized protein n=2 Tax=Piscirickettsia salmonis TaxID=1238 RepID=A0A9Q5VJ03_PISSA|nr:hypothetical protein [Piscirickettsia salmonis]ALA26274.1 hypothetical protein KW89_2812 [Piscirickettsia salmonis]APS43710.1 hypothetical protein AVI48_04525 [Piscirickettsia salmonis]APS47064.1 hypothetical protein AVI49_05130 [Piscirickettsia salmonis]APS51492.1 hypothetical protein AVI50_12085 [Piscirickettsia salmonis]APS54704.1 hypothetical protein AVI51_11965 [Piscirickettsia salmonis]
MYEKHLSCVANEVLMGTITLNIFCDGTGINLNSPVELKSGRSLIGERYLDQRATPIQVDLNNTKPNPDQRFYHFRGTHLPDPRIIDISEAQQRLLKVDDSRDEEGNVSLKMYFPGPSATTCTYEGHTFESPGEQYNQQKIGDWALSQDYLGGWIFDPSRRLGISGDTWRFSLQQIELAVANIKLNHPDDEVVVNLEGYSRGAITAGTGVTSAISDLLGKSVKCNVKIIDPVAGGNYGSLSHYLARNSHTKGTTSLNPIQIGENTSELTLIYATQEKRDEFRPQLPMGYDTSYRNQRPLLIPDHVTVTVIFEHACHQTSAYTHYKSEPKQKFIGGEITRRAFHGQNLENIDCENYSTEHYGSSYFKGDKNSWIYTNKRRVIDDKTSAARPCVSEIYDRSVLYDCFELFRLDEREAYRIFTRRDFISLLRQSSENDNKQSKLAKWSYYNSNFYAATHKTIENLTDDQLEAFLRIQPKTFTAESIKEILDNPVKFNENFDMLDKHNLASFKKIKKLSNNYTKFVVNFNNLTISKLCSRENIQRILNNPSQYYNREHLILAKLISSFNARAIKGSRMSKSDSKKLSRLKKLYMNDTKKLTIDQIRSVTDERTYRKTQGSTVQMIFANFTNTTSSKELDEFNKTTVFSEIATEPGILV